LYRDSIQICHVCHLNLLDDLNALVDQEEACSAAVADSDGALPCRLGKLIWNDGAWSDQVEASLAALELDLERQLVGRHLASSAQEVLLAPLLSSSGYLLGWSQMLHLGKAAQPPPQGLKI